MIERASDEHDDADDEREERPPGDQGHRSVMATGETRTLNGCSCRENQLGDPVHARGEKDPTDATQEDRQADRGDAGCVRAAREQPADDYAECGEQRRITERRHPRDLRRDQSEAPSCEAKRRQKRHFAQARDEPHPNAEARGFPDAEPSLDGVLAHASGATGDRTTSDSHRARSRQ
jgi:hypothetical protein